MKSVRVFEMTLKNFMGIKNYTLDAGGEDLNVFGRNATGKTTLFNAFLWLLFDKDSQNQKDFLIKTIENGEVTPMLDHEVEVRIEVADGTDSKFYVLKKVYREIWRKKQGSPTTTFSGHEVVYFIDDVPKKKGEYTKFIESIVEEEIFKLLTSPVYFNEKIKWQDRRKVLLRVAGEVSDDEVFGINDKLRGLAIVVEGRKIEDFRAIQAGKKKKINDELEKLPIRVDEIQMSIPAESIDLNAQQGRIDDCEKQIEQLKEQISNIKNGNAIQSKRGELMELKNQMAEMKRNIEDGSRQEVYKLRTKIQEQDSNMLNLKTSIKRNDGDIELHQKRKAKMETDIQALRVETVAMKKEVYIKPISDSCDCPTCGQSLPEDQVRDAEEKALAAFNLSKSTRVERKTKEGVALKGEIEQTTALIAKIKAENDALYQSADKEHKQRGKFKEQLEVAEKNVQDVSDNKDYQLLVAAAAEVEEAISGLSEGAEEAAASINDEIAELKAKKAAMSAEFSKFANVPELKKRIAELKEQEEKLAAEYELIEQHIYLTEEFMRAKVRIMEERINSKFKFARFKLFETQVNGGLNEVCETQFNGVGYTSLNNAAKINIGLDIINTLSEFHEIKAPIFVDNAEAVVNLIDTKAQMISLIVSGEDKSLRIERKEGAAV